MGERPGQTGIRKDEPGTLGLMIGNWKLVEDPIFKRGNLKLARRSYVSPMRTPGGTQPLNNLTT